MPRGPTAGPPLLLVKTSVESGTGTGATSKPARDPDRPVPCWPFGERSVLAVDNPLDYGEHCWTMTQSIRARGKVGVLALTLACSSVLACGSIESKILMQGSADGGTGGAGQGGAGGSAGDASASGGNSSSVGGSGGRPGSDASSGSDARADGSPDATADAKGDVLAEVGADAGADGALDAGPDALPADPCPGKEDGFDCSQAQDGTRICLADICRSSRCGDRFVNPKTQEECDEPASGCVGCRWACKEDGDCSDSEMCTGIETCDLVTHLCVVGAPLSDGTSCVQAGADPGLDDGGSGRVCRSGQCVPAGCGNGVVDNGEECDTLAADGGATPGCQEDCRWQCTPERTCDDGNVCNGAETCEDHSCVAGASLDCDDTRECTADSCVPASGCVSVPIDADQDGYNLCDGDQKDCDDNNANVFPGAAECFDAIDNNCDDQVDEGLTSLKCYQDPDRDGYAAVGAAVVEKAGCSATCDEGYTKRAPNQADATSFDCEEYNVQVNPGQVNFFSGAYCTGNCSYYPCLCLSSYDYNCDATAEKEFPYLVSCNTGIIYYSSYESVSSIASAQSLAPIILPKLCYGAGWLEAVPECGKSGKWAVCSSASGSCIPVLESTKTQNCR